MRRDAGFTLIELIMVMILVGILAVFALPRLSLFSGFDEAGVAERLALQLSAAQKLAVANRRTVYVSISAATLQACYDAACASPARAIDGTALRLDAPGSSAFTSSSAAFSFDSLGRSSSASAISISLAGRSVQVEGTTGLARSLP